MVIMFVGIVLIFLGAIKNEDDDTMLEVFWDYVQGEGNATSAIGSIILLLILVGAIGFVVSDSGGGKKKEDET